jgi:hypothetical protein
MSEEKGLKAKSKISAPSLLFFVSAFILSTFCLANTMAVLNAASLLNEIGEQCAFAASKERLLPAAEKATRRVLDCHKPDGFFIREPLICKISEFRDRKEFEPSVQKDQGRTYRPYVRTETSFRAWIPALFLFGGSFKNSQTEPTDSSVVDFSATHSSPTPALYETQKSGRSSI